MAIQLNEARNPQWSNAGNTAILLECQFEHLPGEFVQFSAMPTDTEAHGREIFQRASDGEFGAIAPYETPVLTAAQVNAPVLKALAVNDAKIIRALAEGDTARIEAHKVTQAALRAQLI